MVVGSDRNEMQRTVITSELGGLPRCLVPSHT